MIRDRENGAMNHFPGMAFERYRIRALRILDLDSGTTVTLSAEIVNEAKPIDGVAGFVNLVVEMDQFRSVAESFERLDRNRGEPAPEGR